jgi:hypothetical protein
MPNPNLSRQLPVFDPSCLAHRKVRVIGVGAVGGRIAMDCAKHGVRKLLLCDFDKVEEHNLCNQLFGPADVGKLKVDAIAAAILRDTGIIAETSNKKVKGEEIDEEIVFLAVDKMSIRKSIWNKGLKMKLRGGGPRTELMVETRMGADCGYVYAVNPCDMVHVSQWEKTLYSDKKAQAGVCGLPISVGATAGMTASWAMWQFINWCEKSLCGKSEATLCNELFFSTRPPALLKREFSSRI